MSDVGLWPLGAWETQLYQQAEPTAMAAGAVGSLMQSTGRPHVEVEGSGIAERSLAWPL